MFVKIFTRLLAICSILLTSLAWAQSYPNHVVRIILPYPPGGSMDALGRMVFDRLSQSLGQQFVIDYRGGANGNIAHDIVARAPAPLAAMRDEFSPAEIAELGIGLALFHGFSKMLIISGCEPEEMATTVLSVPGAQPR